MSKASVEEIKLESRALRGHIQEAFADPALSHVEENENVLLKFHGTYQQDDRDLRAQRTKEKLDKAWSFMVRSKMPGGRITAAQWLIHDDLAKLSDGSVRLTNRQGIQLHGTLKGNLKEVIGGINRSGLTTIGACGDVVRNTMGPAAPVKDAVHTDTQQLAEELSQRFLWRSQSYSDIWLDGEKVELDWAKSEVNPAVREKTAAPEPGEAGDAIYGKVYLPRKFKIGISIQPQNDVDVFSQDVGLVPHVVSGAVEGYTVVVGGGFGMSHGQVSTRPFLAQPLFYVRRPHVVDAVEAIVTTQRDHGNRTDRKNARLKYTVQTMGIDAFREEVTGRLPGIETQPAKPLHFDTVEDSLGWHAQGDGKLYCAVYINMGRISDRPDGPAYRSAFSEIAKELNLPFIVTPNTNLIIADIPADKKGEVDAILAKHRVPHADGMTATRRVAHACVALPTCGLSLSESERVLPAVLDSIDASLRELGLANDPILIRMTGCPNGCGRPYNADFGFVGRGPNKYAMFVGGSIAGDRLAGLEQKTVALADIPGAVRPYLEAFVRERQGSETFSAWFGRTRNLGPAPDPEQFHVELSERAARLAGQKAEAAG
ncbi:MAG TPA: NADPH-dependent assimilatory sulfite reductase hemoprotein subunit [Verrucomicrobiales bacterium]|jgi:sulfite reductase beta subunit-like hemoprotein|nr:NADPH-dependent assimilatory sulfite reductase hemoprotein subunit [Verrucomicrobiales bacterium]